MPTTEPESESENLVDSRRNPAQREESLQLQDVEVGHADALHFARGLQCLHPLQSTEHPADRRVKDAQDVDSSCTTSAGQTQPRVLTLHTST